MIDEATKVKDPADLSVQGRAEPAGFVAGSDIYGGGSGNMLVQIGQVADETAPWNPLYPNRRDRQLKDFSRTESMLASGLYSMKTRMQTLNYKLNGPPRAKRFAEELLLKPGLGDSYPTLLAKMTDDLLTSDNGVFVELWRAGNPTRDAGNSPVLGFAHLDSRQCWRSFDPEFPVWYTNPQTGKIYKLHRSRVLMAADNPQPIELARGIGFCATSRALRWSRLMRNILIYRDEKVTGRFTRAIGAVKGVTAKQLQDALRQTEDDASGKGFIIYKGVPFLLAPGMEGNVDIDIIVKDLASFGDGFEFHDDINLYAYVLALAFAIDAREFWPATSSGATKADASIQNMKARGRGMGALIQILQGLTRQCLPDTVTFEYDYTDDDADKQAAEIHQTRTTTLTTVKREGGITAQEYRTLLINENVIDGTLVPAELPVDAAAPDQPAEGQQPENETVAEADSVDPDIPDDAEVGAAARKSVDSYRNTLKFYVRSFWESAISYYEFIDSYQKAIKGGFTEAWAAGAKMCGMTPDDMTEAEQARLDLEIYTEMAYVPPFAQAIMDGSKANGGSLDPLFTRCEMWANAYGRIMSIGQTMACVDGKSIWMLGYTTEHCADCVGYSTRVYRNSVWRKILETYDAMPRGRGLECKGYNCACYLDNTDQPLTRGRPPRPVGAFKTYGFPEDRTHHPQEVFARVLEGLPAGD